ncbi:MAG: efflux RND transporter permease subunit [Pseudomonadales bacterium]|nr:efflux RND transporter permease subunit [Pseudomonadales bacterium]MBO6563430.1 efflux RND transporter permease subunit [Pseudomonadales bacterium]MBO6595745.1 efflux RND transporter permease subunit [Pseudomonadales bacterium]MBO6820697.1 efflux RND transporter permease subunit [Pseudomonadales bacterium]
MNSLVDAAVSRTRTTLLLMLMVVIAGVASMRAISIEADPYIQVPFFEILVFHEGISPEDAERLLVLPMEVELRGVEGIEEIKSYASENFGIILVEFDADYDVTEALLDVRDAVDRAKAELPSTAEEPIISEETTADFPILQVNLVGDDVPERVLYDLALDLRNEIERQPTVLNAELQGQREEVLEIIIDPVALESYRISGEELIGTLARNNRLVPAGSIDTGEGRFSVKVPSVIERAQDVYDLPVKTAGDAVVTVKDVATIRRAFKDRSSYARVNGQRTISINVIKRANANIIDTVAGTKKIVERARKDLPAKVEVFYTQDQAPWAEAQVRELQGNILTALALVMIIVVAAMGLRSGIIVGIGIPVSLVFAVTILHQIGFTYNFMVMFGMLLALGMLIDGAIVVTEYADRRMIEGAQRQQAYADAAKRMFWPVVASIATTLAAFLPLMFWPGMVGKFMRYLPVTVFTVLAGSLLYALVFAPAIGAVFGKAEKSADDFKRNLDVMENGDPTTLGGVTGFYARVLRWCSKHAFVTLGLTIGVLWGSFAAYGTFGKGVIFFSESEPQFAMIRVKARGNMSASEINELVSEVEDIVVEVDGIKDVNLWTMTPGGPSRGARDRIGMMFVELIPETQRSRTGTEILEEVRTKASDLSGFTIEVEEMEQGPNQGKPIVVQFASFDRSLIEPSIEEILQYMETVEGLRDLEDTRSLPGLEWKLSVDRAQAALYGADVTSVGLAVQLVTNGVKIGEYRPDRADDAVDIRVRYPEKDRGINALDQLKILTPQGLVPISNFVSREAAHNVDTIQRFDGKPVGYIRAGVAPGVLADTKVKEMQAWLASQDIDPRLEIEFRGANEEQEESQAFTEIAFLLSLMLMFVLLVTQFNSLYQALLILFAVVMSTAGVLLGLLITDRPFSSLLTGIGIVALAGIVVNNNIVLIDTFNHVRRKNPNLDYVTLIVRTGAQRLRPVILTTLTTVFGLLPLAMNFSVDLVNRSIQYGSQMSTLWVPLSQAIVSGMAFAALLTLVATPALLAIPYQLAPVRDKVVEKSRSYMSRFGLTQ